MVAPKRAVSPFHDVSLSWVVGRSSGGENADGRRHRRGRLCSMGQARAAAVALYATTQAGAPVPYATAWAGAPVLHATTQAGAPVLHGQARASAAAPTNACGPRAARSPV